MLEEIGAAAAQTGGRATPEVERVIEEVWPRLNENVTIDYGVMERAQRIVVIPVSFGWNDIGSWAQVSTLFPENEAGNVIVGLGDSHHAEVNTSGTFIYSTTGRRITTAGLDGIIIVDTGDTLLVCSKDQAQQVKELSERMRQLRSE